MLNLNEFQTFTANKMDLDDLVALAAFGRQLREEYESLKVEEPEFVGIQLKALRREIQSRVADKIESRRKHLKLELERLRTPSERRELLQKELDELNTATV